MTEIPRQPSVSSGTETLDWADPTDLPVEEVRDVFVTLSKALRAYQLYDPNNPVYKRFVQNLREALARLWTTRDQLQILVEEERFTWLGEEVYRNENRSESLAFIFYRDGIRDLTMKKGVEEEELESLLDAMHRAKHARQEGDDLVTILWDLDLRLFGYTAVDLAAEGAQLLDLGEPQALNATAVIESEMGDAEPEEEEGEDEEAGVQPGPAKTVQQRDFNPTLYALDDAERGYLRAELAKEVNRDLRTDVVNALFDRLEDRHIPGRQEEIIGVLRTLLPNFLSRGAVASAAHVIREMQQVRARGGVLSDEAELLADGLVADLSAREAVEEMLRALDDGTIRPDAEEFAELVRHLRAPALAPLLKGAEEAKDERVRALLRAATGAIGERSPEIVVRLLASPDPAVAAGAVRLAGRLGIVEAGSALAHLLETAPREVQHAVLETAEVIPSAPLAGALQRLLGSADGGMRVAAARVLGRVKYAPAAPELKRILEGKELRQTDVTEKVAFFEAYGTLAGEGAVEFLDRVLNGRGFLGRREPADVRAGAALGLGKVGTTAARAALERARDEEDPVVRSAVGRALKSEGGSDG